MLTIMRNHGSRPARKLGVVAAAVLVGLSLSTGQAAAQEAIGVPFVGTNHLSFYTTELSRDGVADERASVFGAVYGHRFGDRMGKGEVSFTVRAGARALNNGGDGILDTGLGFAGTKAIPGAERLSATASVGLGAMVWGQDPLSTGAPDTGRLSLRVPMTAGLAYDLHWGAATVAPFAALATSYSSERDYVSDVRVGQADGWRVGSAVGVSVRFRETVLSMSGLSREHGLTGSTRYVFSAGMSW
ncbi:MAG: hypothetical protein PVH96_12060 [Gemmatimonadota bacterium]|jgi:hypothetical protein